MRSLLLAVSGVAATADLPRGVTKVVELLEAHQKKVQESGDRDAKSYNEFACWCRDTGKDKRDAISTQEETKSTLEADIEAARVASSEQRTIIADSAKAIKELKQKIVETAAEMKEVIAKLDMENLEMSEALTALREATKRLKAGDKQSGGNQANLMQTMKKVEPYVLAFAPQKFAEFMQTAPAEAYAFHSQEIIEILEDLSKDFQEQHASNLEMRAQEKHRYDTDLQLLHDEKEQEEKKNKEAEADLGRVLKELGSLNTEFTTVSAGLADNTDVLRDLVGRCNKVKEEWDVKEETRLQELAALGQATQIIRTSFASLLQQGKGKVVRKHIMATSFVQVKAVTRAFKTVKKLGRFGAKLSDPREMAVNILENAASTYNSKDLAAIATAAGADPFKKVKSLIKQLITKLQNEASEEQDLNNFCVAGIKKAKTQRDDKTLEIRELKKVLNGNDELLQRVKKQMHEIESEVYDVNKAWKEAKKLYETQTENNNETIHDAEQGIQAIKEATQVLTDFYESAPKHKKDHEENVRSDTPDAGFKFGMAKENESAAKGIFAMLEVIDGDLDITIKDTNQLQKEMDAEHADLKATSESTLMEKQKQYDSINSQAMDARVEWQDTSEAFQSAIQSRDSALKQLSTLDQKCNQTSVSYDDRVQARKNEMEALKEALTIFTEYDE